MNVMREEVVENVLRSQDDVFGVTAPPRVSCSQSTPVNISLESVSTGQTCLVSRETCRTRAVHVLVTTRVMTVTRSWGVAGVMESAPHRTPVTTHGSTSRVQILTSVTWICTTATPTLSVSTQPSPTPVSVRRVTRVMADSLVARLVIQAVANMDNVQDTLTTRVTATWAGLEARATRGVSVMATARVTQVWASVTTVTTTPLVTRARFVQRDSSRTTMTVSLVRITVMDTRTRVFWPRTTGRTCVSTVRMGHVDPGVTRVWRERSEHQDH